MKFKTINTPELLKGLSGVIPDAEVISNNYSDALVAGLYIPSSTSAPTNITVIAKNKTTLSDDLQKVLNEKRAEKPKKVKGVIGTRGPSAEISPDALTLEQINAQTESSGATTLLRKRAVKIALSYVGANEVKYIIPDKFDEDGDPVVFQNLGWYDSIFQTKMENLGQRWKVTNAWCNCFTNLVWEEALTVGNALVGAANNPTWANTFKVAFDGGEYWDDKEKEENGGNYLDLSRGTSNTYKSFRDSYNGKYWISKSEAKSGKKLPQPGDMVRYNHSHIELIQKVYTDKDGKITHYDSITGNSSSGDPRDGGGLLQRKKISINTTMLEGITGFCVLSDTYS